MAQKSGHGSAYTALLGSAAVSIALQAAPAMAQTQQSGVEEIVVTAERHAQNILMVPTAIQAETGKELNDQGIQGYTDLQFITPGFLPSTSAGYTQLFIRGIGNSIFVGADPSVATYVDDVPRLYPTLPSNFLDVQRVEVLKGAQGGLYGRNASGGVVNLITLQPSTDLFYGTAQISYGSYDSTSTAAYINVPIDDTLAWSISARRDASEPYVKNIAVFNPYKASDFSGNSAYYGTPAQQAALLNAGVDPIGGLGGKNQYGADTKLLWQPTSNFKVTFAGDYYFENDTVGQEIYYSTPTVLTKYLANNLYGYGFSVPGCPTNCTLPPGIEPTVGKFQNSIGTPDQDTVLHDWGGSITAVWNTSIADVTDITAYRGEHTIYAGEDDASSVPVVDTAANNKKHFYYEEVRALSNGQGPFHWLGGGTFLSNYLGGITPFMLLVPPTPQTFVNIAGVHDLVQDWTIYGQGGYDITEQLNFTASLRYLQETNNGNFDVPVIAGVNSKEHALIPSANLTYTLDDGSVYIRWARGFKAGGVNVTAAPGNFPLPSDGSVFGPEKVDTYEAGYKQALLDRRLQITADIFYNKYNGLQVSAHANAANESKIILAIVNAGSARTYGAEGSVTYQIIDPLTVGINVGYLDAMYENFSVQNNTVLEDFNLDDTGMLNSPKWQVSFTANLDQPINDDFHLIGNILESHISSVLFSQSGLPCAAGLSLAAGTCEPGAIGPGYWLTNLRLGVRTSDDKYELSLYVNNVFDTAYDTYGNSDSEGNILSWGNPRIIGGQFSVNF